MWFEWCSRYAGEEGVCSNETIRATDENVDMTTAVTIMGRKERERKELRDREWRGVLANRVEDSEG